MGDGGHAEFMSTSSMRSQCPHSRIEGPGSVQGFPNTFPAAILSVPASLSSCIDPDSDLTASSVGGSGPTNTNPLSCQPHPLTQWLCVHPLRVTCLYCFAVGGGGVRQLMHIQSCHLFLPNFVVSLWVLL